MNRREQLAEIRARRHFRETVLARGPCVRHGAECRYEIQDPHHVIKAQTIRDALRGTLTPEELHAVVYDPGWGVRVCRPLHRELDGHSFRHGEHTHLTAAELPEEIHELARIHGLRNELERAIPELVTT